MRRVLVANRGEIALRVVRACFDEGLESVVAASEVDRESLPALAADRVVVVGPPAAAESYLSVERMVAAAMVADCDALHPGYGFLSERPELAEACEEASIAFVGPPADVMRRAGDKMLARQAAEACGIPTGGGNEIAATLDDALAHAEDIGYPVMVKAAAGGGGRGMAIARDPEGLRSRFSAAHVEAQQAFGDGRLYIERYMTDARHVEVQILADTAGSVVHVGERDCSCQRRHQKLVEEAPAVLLDDDLVTRLRGAAVDLAHELGYIGAGTVEFLVDVERSTFIFLEVNARIQVEHPVTETVTGIDLVREQLRIAAGAPLSFAQDDVTFDGHAVECRVNAEDPRLDFAPSPGMLARWAPPQGTGVRLDSHCRQGDRVPPHYDSLLGKLITHAPDRISSLALMGRALERFRVCGVETTIPLLRDVVRDTDFLAGPVTTRWLEETFMPRWNPDRS